MTQEHCWRLLKDNEDPSSLFVPTRFDRQAAITRAHALGELLHSKLNLNATVTADFQLNDASFHAEINLPNAGKEKSWVTVRLSNFGNLATVISSGEIEPQSLRLLLDALNDLKYVFIPADFLNQPYTGKLSGVSTWMARFFGHF